MSEIKNPPIGKWDVVKTIDGHGVYEKGWGFVAIHPTSCHAHWNEGQAERRALIVSAPELLEAVEAMLEWDAREEDQAVGFRERLALCAAAFDKARAAHAKATGSQS